MRFILQGIVPLFVFLFMINSFIGYSDGQKSPKAKPPAPGLSQREIIPGNLTIQPFGSTAGNMTGGNASPALQQNQTGGASPSLGLSQIETAEETNVTGNTR